MLNKSCVSILHQTVCHQLWTYAAPTFRIVGLAQAVHGHQQKRMLGRKWYCIVCHWYLAFLHNLSRNFNLLLNLYWHYWLTYHFQQQHFCIESGLGALYNPDQDKIHQKCKPWVIWVHLLCGQLNIGYSSIWQMKRMILKHTRVMCFFIIHFWYT